jgi:hypothetical protein
VRRLVLFTAVAVMAVTAVAYAVTNTMTYTAKVKKSGKSPTAKKPANLTYTGTLAIDTDPPGQQPDIGPNTTVEFAKQIKNNSSAFPTCSKADIDGKPAMPAKCKAAIVGTGTATAYAGQPGNPRSGSVMEDLTVNAVNGTPKGHQLMLVVTSKPGAPVAIANRVIPGTILKGKGLFGFDVRFDIPADLQTQVGLSISLTNFSVTVSGKARKVKIKGKSVSVSYLQLTGCPKSGLPVKATTVFKASDGTLTPVTSTSTAKC